MAGPSGKVLRLVRKRTLVALVVVSLVVGNCVGEGGTNDGLDETNGGDE